MSVRYLIFNVTGIAALMLPGMVAPAAAETGTSRQNPPCRLNRADEDYRYLGHR